VETILAAAQNHGFGLGSLKLGEAILERQTACGIA
jgi:hypothetical protein